MWSARRALEVTADWYRAFYETGTVGTARQFRLYLDAAKKAGAAWMD